MALDHEVENNLICVKNAYQAILKCSYLCLNLQADAQNLAEAAEKKKKRTFRKYSYRGVDLDQLLDMSKYVAIVVILRCNIITLQFKNGLHASLKFDR